MDDSRPHIIAVFSGRAGSTQSEYRRFAQAARLNMHVTVTDNAKSVIAAVRDPRVRVAALILDLAPGDPIESIL